MENDLLAYSVFQQGSGMIHAWDAVLENELGCANRGLDVTADLDGAAHFHGLANRDENGYCYIEGLDGLLWSDGFLWSDNLTETMTVNGWVAQE